ncbi:hypothetical protein NGA77_01610 [Streptococcus suis]|nr:hypothetical protein [Streptococcus suis]MCO0797079.1 hypothetical protein [Streptococcus suis]MCO0808916.1 hypothetical protein [Streptococcus suis]MCO0843816.1 hypothetical protein [Streptococcus suis]
MTELNTILTQLQAASHAGTLKRYEKIGETKPLLRRSNGSYFWYRQGL